MKRDPLAVLSRVRAAEVTAAGSALAAALAEQERCAQAAAAAKHRLRDEQAVGSFADAAAFSRWLPRARHLIAQAEAEFAAAAAAAVRCRAVLAAKRAMAEAVLRAVQARTDEAALMQARRDQAALDEAAAQRWTHGASRSQVIETTRS